MILFLDGVAGEWSGRIGRYEVSTYASEVSSKGIRVRLVDGKGICNAILGRVTMYSTHRGTETTADNFKWLAAHEFGHVLGLRDLYNIFTGSPKPGITSIMNRFGTDVQAQDMANVLKKNVR